MLKRITNPSVTATGTITAGSNAVTALVTADLAGALRVTGVGIPRDTFVASVESGTEVLLTQDATVSNAEADLNFTLEPVTLAEAKRHRRIAASFAGDDADLASMIAAAREACESAIDRSFIATRWRMNLDGFDDCRYGERERRAGGRGFSISSGNWDLGLVIPRAEVTSIDAIRYFDPEGIEQLMDPGAFQAILGTGAYISPAYNTNWAFTRYMPEAVAIEFTAGYGPTAATVPEVIRQAVLLMTGHLYENREATVSTSSGGLVEIPLGIAHLLAVEQWR